MALIGTVPRRCVNLPPGSLFTLLRCALFGKLKEGPDLEAFYREFGRWLGARHVLGGAQGRSVFQLHPHNILYPGLILAVTVLAVNMLGDGLRDTLDPRFAKRL